MLKIRATKYSQKMFYEYISQDEQPYAIGDLTEMLLAEDNRPFDKLLGLIYPSLRTTTTKKNNLKAAVCCASDRGYKDTL